LSVLDAAEQADLSVTGFLDLLERMHAADAAADASEAFGEPPEISVVVPMYNEEGNLVPLLAELVPVLESVGTYEVVFIDDCSTDRSRAVVLEQRALNPNVKLVELARNFGHQGALSAGFDHATGNAVVLMDADLQDPPSVLPEMIERWRAGYEVVYAVREKRKEGPVLRASFFLFYRILQRISEIDLPLDSGDFCLMDRKVVDAIRNLPESNRFLRGLRGWVGFRQVGVTYDRPARLTGETKYSIRSRVRLAIDGLLSFSDVPLRLASFAGFLTTMAAVAYLLIAVGTYLVGGEVVKGWTSIIFVQLILGGVQLMILGVAGEYVSRIYQESKRRPPYVLRTTHGARHVDRARSR
ncbi:MAG TPA: glycosyltransferase family 2 protein, partial [Acidimicrobiales bacterium]|nr:glycosyltransferase family 2 protein [Acidimicrobiales bacterium]